MEMKPEIIDVGWSDHGTTAGLFTASIGATIRDMEYFGCMGKIHRVRSSIPTHSRNEVVRLFLEGEANWLWLVDADMVFDKGHPMKLYQTAIENNVKMVSGLAFIFQNQNQPIPSIFYCDPDNPAMLGLSHAYLPDKPREVAATGLASALIHREVFETMGPVRDEKYRWFDILEDVTNNNGMAGEDVQFFVRARNLGFALFVDPDAETWHIKEIGIGKQDFLNWREMNAGTNNRDV